MSGLQPFSLHDIKRSLNKAGIAGAVQASQVVDAAKLFIASELPETIQGQLEPMSVRSGVLIIKTTSPALSQLLDERKEELFTYIEQVTQQRIQRIQFTV